MTAAHQTIALRSAGGDWSLGRLQDAAHVLAQRLRADGVRVLATLLDNGPAWVIADAAAAQAAVVHVPLPLFFTPAQIAHALRAAGVDALLLAAPLAAQWPQVPARACPLAGETLVMLRLPAAPVAMPAGTAKVTFTSGTTGAPKGVCLRADALHAVTQGLLQAMTPLDIQSHLCALPLPVLLENVAGLATALAHGAPCTVLPLQQLGWSGSSQSDVARFDAAVREHRPHSVIVLPHMLRAWTALLQQRDARAPDGLKLVAVGGAAVGARAIDAARALGLPAHEGYGLSEGASVQTLNLPGADRPGSVGRVLPHARMRVADDGELLVAGALFAGYLGDAEAPPPWWPTGDLGRIDDEGYVHVLGRKKHVLITAFGRNVSPEWVETALRSEPAVAQAVVFGDGEPALSAVLWPLHAGVPDAALQVAVNAANMTLPDYARVRRWVRARAEFSAQTGMATTNGRPQRAAIRQCHADALAAHEPVPQLSRA
ncbi:MAG TPA: AMP-binding protein [Burkholderiaceae bacterium]|nr:AMP-binding protein [Burkholderiaceae bacterium]